MVIHFILALTASLSAAPQIESMAGGGGFSRYQEWLTPGSYTFVPPKAGIYSWACVGGGGGGDDTYTSDRYVSGGSGGQIVFKTVALSSSVAVVIGAGGAVNAAGTASAVSNFVYAAGGTAGMSSTGGALSIDVSSNSRSGQCAPGMVQNLSTATAVNDAYGLYTIRLMGLRSQGGDNFGNINISDCSAGGGPGIQVLNRVGKRGDGGDDTTNATLGVYGGGGGAGYSGNGGGGNIRSHGAAGGDGYCIVWW